MLLKLFTMSALTLSPGELDAYEHTAAVLTNVTRLKQGRALLLQPGRGLLQVRGGSGMHLLAWLPLTSVHAAAAASDAALPDWHC